MTIEAFNMPAGGIKISATFDNIITPSRYTYHFIPKSSSSRNFNFKKVSQIFTFQQTKASSLYFLENE